MALQFVRIGIESLNTAMPHKLLPIEVQFVIVGRPEPETNIPFSELSIALQSVNTGFELPNIAMPSNLLPVVVQFVVNNCAESETCIPCNELFKALQFIIMVDEV